ncbi:MAG: hypothetical protein ACLFN8_04315 [Candidatus Woesearchaeota archaeon]
MNAKKNIAQNILKMTIILILLFIVTPNMTNAEPINTQDDQIIMHFFWDASCPHCTAQKTYNEQLQNKFPELIIKNYQPFVKYEDREIYFNMSRELGLEPRGVPMTIIGDEIWQGFAPHLHLEMEQKIETILNNTKQNEINTKNNTNQTENMVEIPFFGIIDLNTTPILVTTIIIALMDGFNPCSLWLLLFLLGVMVLTGSRKKMMIVGLTFLSVTAIVYGLFISGLFSIFSYVQHKIIITYLVGSIAFIFAIVNIKDYFFYKKGISFTISNKQKSGLFSKMRKILHPENSISEMVIATIILSLGVTLAELPCTAGLPMIWSNLMAAQGITGTNFIVLLAIYLLIYLGIEIILFISAIIAMQKFNFTENHGRILKLISGVIMLVFAYAYVFAYNLTNSLGGIITLISYAILLILLILLITKIIVPYYKLKAAADKTSSSKENLNSEKKSDKNIKKTDDKRLKQKSKQKLEFKSKEKNKNKKQKKVK